MVDNLLRGATHVCTGIGGASQQRLDDSDAGSQGCVRVRGVPTALASTVGGDVPQFSSSFLDVFCFFWGGV